MSWSPWHRCRCLGSQAAAKIFQTESGLPGIGGSCCPKRVEYHVRGCQQTRSKPLCFAGPAQLVAFSPLQHFIFRIMSNLCRVFKLQIDS